MDLEGQLKEKLGESALEQRVVKTIQAFEGLLNRAAAIRFIAKEDGLLEEEGPIKIVKIEKNSKSVTIKAIIEKIWPIANYSSGKKSRVFELSDESGKIPLILWNDDIDKYSTLRTNDKIRLEEAYESGGELHLGYRGVIRIIKRSEPEKIETVLAKAKTQTNFSINIRGKVVQKSEDGLQFRIEDEGGQIECQLTDGFERAEQIKRAIEVIIENGIFEEGLLKIGFESRVLCREAIPQTQTIKSVEADESTDSAIIVTPSDRLRYTREELLELLNVKVADDIKTSTIIKLKKDSLINSKISVDKGQSGVGADVSTGT